MTKVAAQVFDEDRRIHLVHVLSYSRRIAELAPCRASGLIRVHALGDVLLGRDLDERFELLLQLLVGLSPRDESSPAHEVSSSGAGLMIRLIARTTSSHRD